MSSTTRGTAAIAALCWLIVAAATIDMVLGNPTAINAVIGCSIPGAFLTYWTWSLYRQDRATARQ